MKKKRVKMSRGEFMWSLDDFARQLPFCVWYFCNKASVMVDVSIRPVTVSDWNTRNTDTTDSNLPMNGGSSNVVVFARLNRGEKELIGKMMEDLSNKTGWKVKLKPRQLFEKQLEYLFF